MPDTDGLLQSATAERKSLAWKADAFAARHHPWPLVVFFFATILTFGALARYCTGP